NYRPSPFVARNSPPLSLLTAVFPSPCALFLLSHKSGPLVFNHFRTLFAFGPTKIPRNPFPFFNFCTLAKTTGVGGTRVFFPYNGLEPKGVSTPMNFRRFGRTNWQVSELGYGMWGMGAWTGSDDAESLASLQRSVDLGCNFFDTAWVYGEGH